VWHGLIEDIWREQRLLNLPHCHFTFLHPHFMLNLDETCVMVSCGTLRIVGDATIKNMKGLQQQIFHYNHSQ
jgi:hypothetical protein